ncbi:hypothetical protein EJ07DRAFT_160653 [Lizonia empirigonia]|nr:hypothetical protein EJ07DRAFT_160653 [Lizonia empirigonia]
MYQVEGRSLSDPQPQASKMCETPKPRATDSIAPLSSQVAVRDRWHSVITPLTTRHIRPQEEKTRAKSTRKRGYLTEPSRRSGETFGKASDPQTQMLPLIERQQDFSSLYKRVAVTRRLAVRRNKTSTKLL